MTAWALMFNFLAILAVVVFLANAGRLFGPRPKHQGDAGLPYETGLPPLAEAGQGMSALYWRFAVLFVVFDVDLAFLLPWALSRPALDATALISMSVFVGLIIFMLGYFWRKGALSCR
ncbi:MAG TPA: NAD(P)H-quinone oxidoreductase subunit 3 [Elusimicrobia bacterium]|nr:NAD(P)H-quinone oxidoreductase subunit 3 [Elusimicrobiota bacterium]HBT61949.1 NAD(P)H-quinone oxidoreductase subunit 3 [Elusimicrobiota bacterium]